MSELPRLKEKKAPFDAVQRVLRSYYLNGSRIAPVIGVSGPTARKKLENPELFTLKDLYSISKCLGIPWHEIREAMIYK